MPYINQEIRHDLDSSIDHLISHIKLYNIEDREGICNYVITRIVANSLKPESGWRYKWLSRAYGTFLAAAKEFSDRLIRPYEDSAIRNNGDLEELNELDIGGTRNA